MEIESLLRHLHFYAHISHNVLGGQTFFQDHGFLGDLYGAYEEEYDSVVERLIGLGKNVDLVKIHIDAAKDLSVPKSYDDCFKALLKYEEELCDMIDDHNKEKGVSQGTIQLLGDIANRSEMRQYKLKQRLK